MRLNCWGCCCCCCCCCAKLLPSPAVGCWGGRALLRFTANWSNGFISMIDANEYYERNRRTTLKTTTATEWLQWIAVQWNENDCPLVFCAFGCLKISSVVFWLLDFNFNFFVGLRWIIIINLCWREKIRSMLQKCARWKQSLNLNVTSWMCRWEPYDTLRRRFWSGFACACACAARRKNNGRLCQNVNHNHPAAVDEGKVIRIPALASN